MGNQAQAHYFPSHRGGMKKKKGGWVVEEEGDNSLCVIIVQFVQAYAGQTLAAPPKTPISYLTLFVDDKFSNVKNKTYKQHHSPEPKWWYSSQLHP